MIVALCASGSTLEAQHRIVAPKRLAPEQQPPLLPPLPADADHVQPTTMDVVLDGHAGHVLRTTQRILVATEKREWLFQRNSLDPRRVSATIVEHSAKAIVQYEESDLRNLLGINGWAEVLNLTAESNASDQALKVERVRAGVDATLLRPSVIRFPEYQYFEVADWLELHKDGR
jgi:hypothetical protein